MTLDNTTFKTALSQMLTATFPDADTATLTDYCLLLVGMEKDKQALETDLSDVTTPEDASKISDWIFQYLGDLATPNESSQDQQQQRGADDMVINLDMKSDDEMDEEDGDQHHRRERRPSSALSVGGAGGASLLARAVNDVTDNSVAGGRKRKGDHDTNGRNGSEGPPRKSTKGEQQQRQGSGKPTNGARGDVTFTVTVPNQGNAPPGTPTEGSVPRCTFWPSCSRGDDCLFWHPKAACPDYPNCDKGNACYYIHPDMAQNQQTAPCRFGPACTRPNCAFSHPYSRGGPRGRGGAYSARGGYNAGYGAAPPRGGAAASHLAKVQCRFYPSCSNPACPYFHPVPKTLGPAGAARRGSTPQQPTTTEVCKYEPLCSREGCKYTHPSRQPSSETGMYKSKKFQEPIEQPLPSMPQPVGVPGAWKNRTWVANNKPHISDRNFALPDDGSVESFAMTDATTDAPKPAEEAAAAGDAPPTTAV
ncbi:hypothetical protein DFJ77DRAFT_479157 [Powellomyces hirtus]|nr:hypothetical protein DFJ77DRAFT_479157 [Powellomyces hirtus]